jgi:DNA segregation ATPase FtsK/SpoIIIE-like protein
MNKQLPLQRIVAASLGAVLLTAAAGVLADPPARVARLAYIDGPVSFAPAGENTWEYAAVNRPLIAGDRLWVEAGARDEMQVGGAALRMGGNTLVTLLNIDDRTTQLQLSQGRLNVRVRRLRPNDVFEIDTPNLALSIRQPGDYRIDVDPAGNATMVAVPRGQAEAYGDGNAYRLGSGQAYIFGGTDLRDVRPARADLVDDFDRWSASRDRRIEQARSVRYVSPDLVGYEDLDDQGNWTTVPDYGNVWIPAHVGRDWAPYRDGHWSYVQPWGWTWIDDAPWGFAVSHYGRWARFPQGWGWVPGPRAASPVYAPALVVFVSIGAGAYAQRERPVAWFPLAPREVYQPSYRASPTYITNINVTNTVLIRNQIPRESSRVEYANRRVGGAVTAVPASAFVHAQPVARAAVALPMAALAGAAIAHVAPVAPEHDGARGRANPGHQPPQAVMARQVLAKNAPPPEFRQAPRPAAGIAAPAPQMAGPAPRVLPQDRHGGSRQLRDVPMPPPAVAGPNGVPPAMPQQERGRGDRRGQQGPLPIPGQPGVAPVAGIPQAPMPPQVHGRDRIEPPPLAHAPTPAPAAAPRDQQNGPDTHRGQTHPEQGKPQAVPVQQRMDQQAAAAQQQAAQQQQQRSQQQAAEQQRNEQHAAEQQRNQQQAAEQQRSQQQAAERQRNQRQAAEQQRSQQQAAEQQRNEQQAAERQRSQQQAAERQRSQQQAAEQQHNQQQAAERQRNQQQAEAQQRQRQQQAAEQQRSQQHAAEQAAAAQQRAQQQAAAEQQHRAERSQRHEQPPPAAPAAQPAQPAQASQQAHANEGKKEDQRHRDHPEQN